MYILKNALRCIGRAKGRNILIGIIVLVIATSACIGLSIRQAAVSAKEDALENLSVTATISFDRQSMMGQMGGRGQGSEAPDTEGSQGGGRGSFDKSQFAEMMGQSSSLTLEEYQTYASASTVKDFYYSLTVSANGSDEFLPVSNDSTDSTESDETDSSEDTSDDISQIMGGLGGMGGMGGMGGFDGFRLAQSDFQLVGYSGESAMTSFLPGGTASVTDGTVFEEGTSEYNCIISEELATYNSLAVGDTVTVTNPYNEEETYTLSVVGIYTDTAANENSFSSMFGMTGSDPANQIYMSYNALNSIVTASQAANPESNSDDTDSEEDAVSPMSGSLSTTYTFANVEDYETFTTEVYTLGLDESYTVSSSDVSQYENSLTPLNSLSTMAGWFLAVILIIGAVILIVLNIFNVRERKYEIGVLTAMGMKKVKVAMQFLTEIFVVTLAAVIIGIGVGAVSSVPVTNALLENQIASAESETAQFDKNFGRPEGTTMPDMEDMPDIGGKGGFGGKLEEFAGGAADYISEINNAMNLTVVLQMFGIAVLLTAAAGAVSMLFIMRYEPLKILANRD